MAPRNLKLNAYWPWRNFALAVWYAILLAFALWISYELRFDFEVPANYRAERLLTLAFVLPIKLFSLLLCGQFRGLLSYFRTPDLSRLFAGLLVPSLLFLVLRYVDPTGYFVIPRGVILADLLFSLIFLAGFRMAMRMAREKFGSPGLPRGKRPRRIGIIGAGSNGAALAGEFLAKPQLAVRPVAFFDDDWGKVGRDIHGIPIVGLPEDLSEAADQLGLDAVAIAIPSLNAKRIREMIEYAREAKLETTIIPSLHELSTGRVKIEEMRKVDVEDLLGRHPVSLNTEPIRASVENRVVLVTGAGGSIGSEIVRQVASYQPQQILLLDHSELAAFTIEREMMESFPGTPVSALVADVCNPSMMSKILAQWRPVVLFHAAAYKHVPLMETQPWEAIANNAIGTFQLSELAIEYGVQRFVLISTDKAINPTSIMGASKRLAEMAIQCATNKFEKSGQTAAQSETEAGHGNPLSQSEMQPEGIAPSQATLTRFMAVRFGNVLGSSGSVIPTFRRQIARGGPVTVTHPEVTRYFMTIPEAVGLVLQAAAMGQGGEIFLLDMGKPVKIIDLARQMIELSGFEPDTEIEIQITGLRPGEKLFEELNYATEQADETEHPRIRKLRAANIDYKEFERRLLELEQDFLHLSRPELRQKVAEMIPEYHPYSGPEDF